MSPRLSPLIAILFLVPTACSDPAPSASAAQASPVAEPVRHFKGKQAQSWAEATAHLTEGCAELAVLLAQPELRPADMVRVHEVSYTLENAVERLRTELAQGAEALERVHKASEMGDAAAVTREGPRFLAAMDPLLP